jgi:5-methylcytosine-specific restriction endonuclease McrA
MCDWNDHSWSEYSGPLYPSIDHIVPMSKGGDHVWNNVQVAHIICNSYKGNTEEAF